MVSDVMLPPRLFWVRLMYRSEEIRQKSAGKLPEMLKPERSRATTLRLSASQVTPVQVHGALGAESTQSSSARAGSWSWAFLTRSRIAASLLEEFAAGEKVRKKSAFMMRSRR